MDRHNDLYIISFGTSSDYRFFADGEDRKKLETTSAVKKYLQERFPDAGEMNFIETPVVKRIAAADESKYSSYPMLDSATLLQIEKHLATEHKVARENDRLDSNAPFDDLNPNALG